MIKELYVSNFAIIEEIRVKFADKMTALTGQTGAGKSLIIDSIGLLLGERADLDLIRYGANKAIIEGLFSYDNLLIDALLDKYGIKKETDLLIHREIASKSVIKINNTSVNLSQLREIALHLADIHVQNDTLRLINPDHYLNIIDSFGDEKLQKVYNNYQIAYLAYKTSHKEYQAALNKSNEASEKIDLWKYQIQELEALNIQENELEEITEEITALSNFDKIYNNLEESSALLNNQVIDALYSSLDKINSLGKFQQKYAHYAEVLSESYYNIEDISLEIKKEIKNLNFDPKHLSDLLERENEIKKTLKKYQKSSTELIAYFEQIKLTVQKVENYDDYLLMMQKKLSSAFNHAVIAAKDLNKERQKIASDLEKKLAQECLELDLKKAIFKIEFKENELNDMFNTDSFTENGTSQVDFLVTLNYGEPLKSLHKVASGGELSRIMLGFKALLVSKQKLGLIVFDEIDSGISGLTASKIAEKIHRIAMFTQVLCITHLPHVASIADHHLSIIKYEDNNRTLTKVVDLDFDSRVIEIATMISGEKLSENAINSAKDLLSKN